MKNRFRFRWYSYIYQEMCEVNCIEPNNEFINFNQGKHNNISTAIKPENGVLMQCTGLKDCTGKLIYEGDIVEEGLTHEVIWDSEYCSFYLIRDKNKNSIGDTSLFDSTGENQNHRIKIIGNIYENKDLLENKRRKND